MHVMDSSQLSKRERQIMDVVYAHTEATVTQMMAEMPDPPKRRAAGGCEPVGPQPSPSLGGDEALDLADGVRRAVAVAFVRRGAARVACLASLRLKDRASSRSRFRAVGGARIRPRTRS